MEESGANLPENTTGSSPLGMIVSVVGPEWTAFQSLDQLIGNSADSADATTSNPPAQASGVTLSLFQEAIVSHANEQTVSTLCTYSRTGYRHPSLVVELLPILT